MLSDPAVMSKKCYRSAAAAVDFVYRLENVCNLCVILGYSCNHEYDI